MNVTGPWSRRVCTHPASVTVDPTSAARRSPSVLVRSILLVSFYLRSCADRSGWRTRSSRQSRSSLDLISRVRQVRALAGGARFLVARVGRRLKHGRDRLGHPLPAHLDDDRGEACLALLLLG